MKSEKTEKNVNLQDGKLRREKIWTILSLATTPVSGTELAKTLGVSRQVIVQDIALLRARNREILSTNKGYLLFRPLADDQSVTAVIAVKHSSDQVLDEFKTILDFGGHILDVSVDHDYYGQIQIDLVINDMKDAEEFVYKMKHSQSQPLKCLTGDVHYHTITAPSQKILDLIRTELRQKGYLLESELSM